MKAKRATCPVFLQHLWNASNICLTKSVTTTKRNIKTVLNEDIGLSYSEDLCEEQFRNAIRDGCIVQHSDVFKFLPREETFRKGNHDWYCFQCHLPGEVNGCPSCHRVFHTECIAKSFARADDDFIPSEYSDGSSLASAKPQTTSPCLMCKLKSATPTCKDSDISRILLAALNRLNHKTNWKTLHVIGYLSEDSLNEYFLFNLINTKIIEKRLRSGNYYNTRSMLLVDIDNLVHNATLIYGSKNQMTSCARSLRSTVYTEMRDSSLCMDCYLRPRGRSSTATMNWLTSPCRIPHKLAWHQSSAFSFRPCKILGEIDSGSLEIIYFDGRQERVSISKDSRVDFSFTPDDLGLRNTPALLKAIELVDTYQQNQSTFDLRSDPLLTVETSTTFGQKNRKRKTASVPIEQVSPRKRSKQQAITPLDESSNDCSSGGSYASSGSNWSSGVRQPKSVPKKSTQSRDVNSQKASTQVQQTKKQVQECQVKQPSSAIPPEHSATPKPPRKPITINQKNIRNCFPTRRRTSSQSSTLSSISSSSESEHDSSSAFRRQCPVVTTTAPQASSELTSSTTMMQKSSANSISSSASTTTCSSTTCSSPTTSLSDVSDSDTELPVDYYRMKSFPDKQHGADIFSSLNSSSNVLPPNSSLDDGKMSGGSANRRPNRRQSQKSIQSPASIPTAAASSSTPTDTGMTNTNVHANPIQKPPGSIPSSGYSSVSPAGLSTASPSGPHPTPTTIAGGTPPASAVNTRKPPPSSNTIISKRKSTADDSSKPRFDKLPLDSGPPPLLFSLKKVASAGSDIDSALHSLPPNLMEKSTKKIDAKRPAATTRSGRKETTAAPRVEILAGGTAWPNTQADLVAADSRGNSSKSSSRRGSADHNEEELRQLRERNEKLMAELASTKQELSSCQTELCNVKSQLHQVTRQNLQLTKDQAHLTKSNDQLQVKLNDLEKRYQSDLNDVKSKFWCKLCLSEALYHCCVNVSYCSRKCQHEDWTEHGAQCQRVDRRQVKQ